MSPVSGSFLKSDVYHSVQSGAELMQQTTNKTGQGYQRHRASFAKQSSLLGGDIFFLTVHNVQM